MLLIHLNHVTYLKDQEKGQNLTLLQENNTGKEQLRAIVVQGSRNEVKMIYFRLLWLRNVEIYGVLAMLISRNQTVGKIM